MKTCEEYVLQELAEAKEKIRRQERSYEKLANTNMTLFEFLSVLKKYMFIAEGSTGKRYIEMKYVFEEYEEKDFEILEAMLMALEEEETGQ